MLRFLSCNYGAHWWFSKSVWTVSIAASTSLAVLCLFQKSPAQVAGRERPAALSERDRLVKEIERRIKGCRDRVTEIGQWLLATSNEAASARDSLTTAQINTSKADGEFRNAVLTREVAEIGVVEYREGIAKQEQATIEGEVKLAESELLRAQDRVAFSKDRIAKIKQLSKGTDEEVALEKFYEDKFPEALKREPYTKRAFDLAQAKLRLLKEHTIPTQIKKRESDVLKARADEFARKAVWQTEKAKESRIEAQIRHLAEEAPARRLREAFTREFDLDQKIRVEQAKISKDKPFDAGLTKMITDLLSELESLIDRTESEVALARVDRLKAAINEGAVQSDAADQAATPAELSGFVRRSSTAPEGEPRSDRAPWRAPPEIDPLEANGRS